MKWIHLKDFTPDYFVERIKKAIEDGGLTKQMEEYIEAWKKDYQPGDIFRVTLQLKLPDFQVLPDIEEKNDRPKCSTGL